MQLVRGSLTDIAIQNQTSIAQAFLGVDAIVMIDISRSMNDCDCPGGRRRFDVARNELIRLQRDLPGKIAVVSWNSQAAFCPTGLPAEPAGSTNLTGVLEFVKPADGAGVRLIVISDGEPDSPGTALDLARQFQTKIDTIFTGPETGSGRDFLRQLAEASGGRAVSQSVRELPELTATIKGLLGAAA